MNDFPKGTKPFDQDELQSCAICKKGIGHSGAIEFYEVTVRQVVVDFKSVRQIAGLELMLGEAAPLAAIMGPTSRIGFRLPAKRSILCHDCFLMRPDETAAVYLWDDD